MASCGLVSSEQLAVSDILRDSGVFSEETFCLDRLFSQEVAEQAFEKQKPRNICQKLWKVLDPESFERARHIKAFVKEAKRALTLSPEEYDSIRRLNASGKLKEAEKILEAKWRSMLLVARQLEDFGYYVFLHAASFDVSLVLEMQTYLEKGRERMGWGPSWESYRKFRDTPHQYLQFENTEDYCQSSLRKDIDDPDSGVVDVWPNNQWLLSCDGFLENKDPLESAFDLYKKNHSFSAFQDLSRNFFAQKFGDSWLASAFGVLVMEKLISTARHQKQNYLVQGQGQVYMMAIPKETIDDVHTSYVYRSHPFGRVCDCIKGHEEFLEELKSDQEGTPLPCQISREGLELNPQYRILAENFDADPDKIVISLDGLTQRQHTELKDQYFWPYAFIMKQLSKLAAFEGSAKDLESLLQLLPTDLSSWAKRASPELRQLIEREFQPVYDLALKQIIKSKQAFFDILREELSIEGQEKLDHLLRLEGIEHRMVEFLHRYPSACDLISYTKSAELLSLIMQDNYPLLRDILHQLNKAKFTELVQGSFGDHLLARAFEQSDISTAAKVIAADSSRIWDFPEDVDLERLFLEAVKLNEKVMMDIPFEITDAFLEKAIKINYEVFRYVDPQSPHYKKLALIALETSPDVFKLIKGSLRHDQEILRMKDYGTLEE